MPLQIRTDESIAAETRDTLNHWLRDFNRTANPVWWAASDEALQPRPLFTTAHDENDRLLGGLIGNSVMKWLRIDIMAVSESARRQGVGRRLLQAAEDEAVRRGCVYAFVDTMSYQAPEFYQRCAYQISGSIPDWDSHDHTKFFLTKSLVVV
ncbi:GNAT family N-acetyltransferase [Roseiconus lacunae]|uniref:GNAT family N-acetyltransferase n=1 Tax=Roseiconus lacunae TaxID=2605694 RepID=UPI0011F21943|nr:GNAT family N-acetyltransferase [Roseiconus lacunae]